MTIEQTTEQTTETETTRDLIDRIDSQLRKIVSVQLSNETARRLSAVSYAANTKSGRQTTDSVWLTITADTIRVAATDSFVAVVATEPLADCSFGYGSDETVWFVVRADVWRETLATAVKAKQSVKIVFDETENDTGSADMTVSAASVSVSNRVGRNGSDEWIGTRIVADNEPTDIEGNGITYNGLLPAVDPRKVAQVAKTLGETASKVPPILMRVSKKHADTKQPELLPIVFTTANRNWVALLMPVRVDRSV